MPKVFVRTQPKSGLKIRHRCAIGFTDVWKEIDVDDATRAALEEDPYLEVSEKPTVLVEVAASASLSTGATIQPAAIQTATDLITPESNTQQDSADAAQGNSEQAGTASAAGGEDQPTDRGPEAETPEALATGDANSTGENAPVVDAAANGGGTAATDGEQQANPNGSETDPLAEIKGAITVLNPNVAENWLADGRPAAKAIELILGRPVSAADRDAAWNVILLEAVAE